MSKVRITDGYIIRKLKYKWTLAQFAEHFNVSEEEFTQILIREFGEKIAKGFLDNMEANKETAQKNLKKKAGKSIRNTTLEENEMPDRNSELNMKKANLLAEIERVVSAISADKAEKNTIDNELAKAFKEYMQILDDVKRREQCIDSLIARKDELAGLISEKENKEKSFRAKLEKIDNELFKLSYIKVNCGISESSETFDMTESDFEITAEELRQKFHELIDDDEKTDLFEDLSMKQMAKVQLYMIIIQRVTEMGKKCKLYFPVDDNVTMALSLLTEDVVVVVEI